MPLNFLIAAVQTGFGPFIAVWLTQRGWDFTDIGVAFSIGTVAGLVCQGLGNRAIGQRLFMSEKTVEAHLTRIYRKLAVSSRFQLMQTYRPVE